MVAKGDDAVATIRFDDGTVVRLFGLGAPGGEAKFTLTSYDTGTKAMVCRLASGLLSVVSPPRDPPPRKTVEALNTVTATQGTEFKVETRPDGDVVSLKVGRVTVAAKAGGAEVALTAGQKVEVAAGKEAGAPTPYDASAAKESPFYVGADEDVDKNFR